MQQDNDSEMQFGAPTLVDPISVGDDPNQ
jgi:hypothetical protein